MIDIIMSNEQDKFQITDELMDKIKRVIDECEIEEGINFDNEISLTFTDNENIRQINKDYRDKDEETDVLSFPMYEKSELEDEVRFYENPEPDVETVNDLEEDVEIVEEDIANPLGDIVISLEKAKEQSEDFGHSFEREVCYLVCHSMFHLLGYDHMTENEKIQMRQKEEKIMDKLGILR